MQDTAKIRRNIEVSPAKTFLAAPRTRLPMSVRIIRGRLSPGRPKKIQVFNLGKKDFGLAIFVVIGANKGKLLRLGQDSKNLNPESGGNEERVASSRIVGVFTPVRRGFIAGPEHCEKGSRLTTQCADAPS